MCLCVCGPRAKSCWETSNTSLRLCCKWEKLITCSYLITALSGSHNVAAFSFCLLFNILVILLLCAKLSLTKFMSNLTCVCVEIWMTTGALKGATVQMVCKMCVYFCRCTKYNTLNMCMSHHSGQLAARPRNKPTATVWLPVTPHVVSMCVTLEIAALSRTGYKVQTDTLMDSGPALAPSLVLRVFVLFATGKLFNQVTHSWGLHRLLSV